MSTPTTKTIDPASLTPEGILEIKADLDEARNLLVRAAACLGDHETAPDESWWREYFTHFRQPMILTEEGWENPESAAAYLENDPEWTPLETLAFNEKPLVPVLASQRGWLGGGPTPRLV